MQNANMPLQCKTSTIIITGTVCILAVLGVHTQSMCSEELWFLYL